VTVAALPIPPVPPARGLLTGRVAVITAAAGTGIGGAVALRFAQEGAAVMLSDRSTERLQETRERLAAEVSTPVAAFPCDVTDPTAIEALYDQAERELGPVDVAFNNAGLGGAAALVDMTDDEWARVMDVTLTSTFQCTRALLRRMTPRRSGVIVNNASVTGWRAEAGQCHYAAAKAGVMALTRCAAVEAAPYGVRINAIAPTITVHENLARAVDSDVLAEWAAAQPQRRPAEPFEIAASAAFLASDLSSYMTGEVLSVSSQHP
jgi:3-oxoacyl-[acyl-carrier protein] reductase